PISDPAAGRESGAPNERREFTVTSGPKRPPSDVRRARAACEVPSFGGRALLIELFVCLGFCFSVWAPIDALNLAGCHRWSREASARQYQCRFPKRFRSGRLSARKTAVR